MNPLFKGRLMLIIVLLITTGQYVTVQGYVKQKTSTELGLFSLYDVYVSPERNSYLIGHFYQTDISKMSILIVEPNGTILGTYNISCLPTYWMVEAKYSLIDNHFIVYKKFSDNVSIWQYDEQFNLIKEYNISLVSIECPYTLREWHITENGSLYLFSISIQPHNSSLSFSITKLDLKGNVQWQLTDNVTIEGCSNPERIALDFFTYSIKEPYIALGLWQDLILIDTNDGVILWQEKEEKPIIDVVENETGPIIGYETEENNENVVAITAFDNNSSKIWTHHLLPKRYLQLVNFGIQTNGDIIGVEQELIIAEDLEPISRSYFTLYNKAALSLGSISKYITDTFDCNCFLISEELFGVVCRTIETDPYWHSVFPQSVLELYSISLSPPISISNYIAVALSSITAGVLIFAGVRVLHKREKH